MVVVIFRSLERHGRRHQVHNETKKTITINVEMFAARLGQLNFTEVKKM